MKQYKMLRGPLDSNVNTCSDLADRPLSTVSEQGNNRQPALIAECFKYLYPALHIIFEMICLLFFNYFIVPFARMVQSGRSGERVFVCLSFFL